MSSFTLAAFLCVAVFSGMALVSHGARLCPGGCPEGWTYHDDRCFQHVADKKSWIDAELNCLDLGGNLASEHSEDDHTFLKDLHKSVDPTDTPFWLGLSTPNQGKTWLWSDGTSAKGFSMWNENEPNNAGGSEFCVHTNYGDTKNWNDAPCDAEYASICVLRMEE